MSLCNRIVRRPKSFACHLFGTSRNAGHGSGRVVDGGNLVYVRIPARFPTADQLKLKPEKFISHPVSVDASGPQNLKNPRSHFVFHKILPVRYECILLASGAEFLVDVSTVDILALGALAPSGSRRRANPWRAVRVRVLRRCGSGRKCAGGCERCT